MRLIGDGFSSLGITALNHAVQSDTAWISIDEIGYLESQCDDYLDRIFQAMEQKHVAAVVRKQNLSHLKKLCEREDVFLIDLDLPFGNMGCIIMASGFGKRFGKNKLMAEFHGRPLISYILDTTSGMFQNRIVVTRYEEVANFCKSKNADIILHHLPHQSDTIRLGLETQSTMEHCIFCTADQPLLTQDTIASLALLAVNTHSKILRPAFDNIPGSPVVFPRWTFEELLHLPDGKSGGHVIKHHLDHVQYLWITNPYELEDIDMQDDLIRLQELSKEFHKYDVSKISG